MPQKTTIEDIAAAVGVSTTTVFKALHGKGKVSDAMREKILRTAAQMQYTPNRYAQALARREIRIGFIAHDGTPEYQDPIYKGLVSAFAEYSGTNVSGEYFRYRLDNAYSEILQFYDEVAQREDIDALLIQSFYTDERHTARLSRLAERGLPILSLGGRMAGTPVSGYIMTNGKVMGQMAAQYLSLLLPPESKVAVLTPGLEAEMHRDCIRGFQNSSFSCAFTLTGVTQTGYAFEEMQAAVDRLLEEQPDLRGIYLTTYNAAVLCAHLKKRGMGGKIAVVGQDLYPELAECLRDGSLAATLFQNQQFQGRRAVEMLLDSLTNPQVPIRSEYVAPQLVMLSNLECFSY